MKKRLIVLVLVVVIAIVAVAVVVMWPSAPVIPADHAGRTTCGCHETGAGGAPVMPQWHLDRLADGRLSDNVTDCLECHEYES